MEGTRKQDPCRVCARGEVNLGNESTLDTFEKHVGNPGHLRKLPLSSKLFAYVESL